MCQAVRMGRPGYWLLLSKKKKKKKIQVRLYQVQVLQSEKRETGERKKLLIIQKLICDTWWFAASELGSIYYRCGSNRFPDLSLLIMCFIYWWQQANYFWKKAWKNSPETKNYILNRLSLPWLASHVKFNRIKLWPIWIIGNSQIPWSKLDNRCTCG